MKLLKLTAIIFTSLTTFASAAKPPAILAKFFDANKEVRGEIVKVDMPGEFLKYRELLSKAQAKDPEWFEKHQEKAGEESLMLPYDAKLGISKADHAKYKALYEKRKFKRIEGGEVSLILTEDSEGVWSINVFAKKGVTTPFSALSYIAKDDAFKSINGNLVRIEDITSPKESVYGSWNGFEYRYFEENNLVKTKENIAIGRTGDGRYGLLFHSLQELSGRGQLLADNLLIIRFVPNKIKK